MSGSHRRRNALTGEWVLVSPHRTLRPWQGQHEAPPPVKRPAFDPECYLCPGNKRANGAANPQYTQPYVFANDFSALDAAGDASAQGEGLFDVAGGLGGMSRAVLFAATRSVARRSAFARGGGRRACLASAVRRARCAARSRLRPDLRESRRDDGREQPASARADLGDECRAGRSGTRAAQPADVSRGARPAAAHRLRAGGTAGRRSRRVLERSLGCAGAVLGSVAVRAARAAETVSRCVRRAAAGRGGESGESCCSRSSRCTTACSMCRFPTRWAGILVRAAVTTPPAGRCTRISFRRCCARRRFANSKWDSRCWRCRNGTSRPKRRPRDCASSSGAGRKNAGKLSAATFRMEPGCARRSFECCGAEFHPVFSPGT